MAAKTTTLSNLESVLKTFKDSGFTQLLNNLIKELSSNEKNKPIIAEIADLLGL